MSGAVQVVHTTKAKPVRRPLQWPPQKREPIKAVVKPGKMFKLDLPQDPKEAAKLNAMREREAARRTRVMNPRQMRMGMDYGALDTQVMERAQAKLTEKQRNDEIGASMIQHDRLLQMLERRQKADAKAMNRAVVEYRQQHQQMKDRREWDLNDPDKLKNEQIPEITEDDARFGPASMQYFEGEDSNASSRTSLQKQQMREWVKASAAEKAAKAEAERAEKDAGDALVAAQTKHMGYIMEEQAKVRQQAYMAAREENAVLMQQKAAIKAKLKEEEQLADYEDVINAVNSELLDDSASGAYDQSGRLKHVKNFRGFLPEQLEAIRQEQEVQKVEQAERKREEQMTEALYQQQESDHARLAHLAERQRVRDQKAAARELNAENSKLSSTREIHCIDANTVGQDFFSQFGTSSR